MTKRRKRFKVTDRSSSLVLPADKYKIPLSSAPDDLPGAAQWWEGLGVEGSDIGNSPESDARRLKRGQGIYDEGIAYQKEDNIANKAFNVESAKEVERISDPAIDEIRQGRLGAANRLLEDQQNKVETRHALQGDIARQEEMESRQQEAIQDIAEEEKFLADKAATEQEAADLKAIADRRMRYGEALQQMGHGLGQWQDSINSLSPSESIGAMSNFIGGFIKMSTLDDAPGSSWGKFGSVLGILGTALNIRGQRESAGRTRDYKANLASSLSTALLNAGKIS